MVFYTQDAAVQVAHLVIRPADCAVVLIAVLPYLYLLISPTRTWSDRLTVLHSLHRYVKLGLTTFY